MSARLAINKCPTHGWWSVSVDGEHGGQRVTPSKCCGRWEEVKSFQLSGAAWRELSELAAMAAESEEGDR